MKNTFFEQNITEVNNYLTKIKADYHAWQDRCKDGCPEVKDKMFDEFCDGVSYSAGRNYLKISTGHSTHSFIVIKPTKGFKEGDILMAKSWAAPATNFARGNIFEDYTIRWTGAV